MALELSNLMLTDEQIARLNADNIEKAIAIMKEVRDRKDLRFDITSVIEIPRPLHDVTEKEYCGTIVCMAGALCIMPGGVRGHLKLHNRMNPGKVLEEAAKWLGISQYGYAADDEIDITKWLFMPSAYEDTKDIDEAINRLQHLLDVARQRDAAVEARL